MAQVNLADEFRGDTIVWDVTLNRAGASAGWMTGGEMWFTVKRARTDDDSLAVIKASTLMGGPGGIDWVDADAVSPTATITIDPDDYDVSLLGDESALLQYDIQIKDADGRIETVQYGTWTIKLDVQRSDTE